jgi:hypothetical protein
MHMWPHVTNHLIISTDKDSNSENRIKRIKLRVRDTRLDMSWIGSVASSMEMAVLSSDSEPLLAESFGELMGFRDVIRRFRCDGAGEYPGQTQ